MYVFNLYMYVCVILYVFILILILRKKESESESEYRIHCNKCTWCLNFKPFFAHKYKSLLNIFSVSVDFAYSIIIIII